MTRWTLTVWLLVWLPGLAPGRAADPPVAQPARLENYRVLSERNMFLRNRARPPASHAAPAPPRAAPADTGDDRIVLTGIIQQGEDYLAFFEDTRTGKTTTLQAGDPSLRCATCHAKPLALAKSYHLLCVGCHDTARNAVRVTGPRACGECHARGK